MAKDESALLKPFKERDLQRVRNLVNKKFGEKTTHQVGYKKEDNNYKEGDNWEENGKKWTIKNGIKQTITSLDILKKLLQLPLVCPKCNNPMKNKELDKKMFFLHKMCFNCVIEYETELKRQGKYEEYEKSIIQNNVSSYIKDLEDSFRDFVLEKTNNSFVTEQGDIETWNGGDIDYEQMAKDLKEYINNIKLTVGL